MKKMRKSQESKRSVDKLKKAVTRLVTAGDLPFDMLLDPDQSIPDPYAPSAQVALAANLMSHALLPTLLRQCVRCLPLPPLLDMMMMISWLT